VRVEIHQASAGAALPCWEHHARVIFVNENENDEKRENNELVNEN